MTDKELAEIAQAAADAERVQWWNWLEKHQLELTNIPKFEDWKKLHLQDACSDTLPPAY